MAKRPVNLNSAAEKTAVDLADLQSEYDRLLGSLAEVARIRTLVEADPGAYESVLEQRRQSIQDRLHTAARRIAETKANSLSGVALKAKVLLDWCELDRDDVVTKLTVSLCRDVLRSVRTGPTEQDADDA